jgi:hypothetical protein
VEYGRLPNESNERAVLLFLTYKQCVTNLALYYPGGMMQDEDMNLVAAEDARRREYARGGGSATARTGAH